MSQRFYRPLVTCALVAGGALFALFFLQNGPRAARSATSLTPYVHHTILNVSCVSAANFNQEYTKITDIGDFTVVSDDAVVEVTYQGRVNVDTLTGTSGTVYELRVNNLPSTVGSARAHVNTVGSQGEYITFTGVFTGLEPGEHTVSMWVRTSTGNTGTGGRVDPGCWSSDVVIVREYTAFGHVFLPLSSNE